MSGSRFFYLFSHRWPTMSVLLCAAMAAGAVYSSTAKKQYFAQATLEVGPEAQLITTTDASGQNAGVAMWERYFRTQLEVLRSRAMQQRVYDQSPAEMKGRFQGRSDPLGAFSRQFEIAEQRGSLVIKVGFWDYDPKLASDVVNALVKMYVEEATSRIGETSSARAGRLSQQVLPELRTALDEADRKLQEFQKANGWPVFEEQYRQKLQTSSQLEARLAAIKVRRLELEARVEALKGASTGVGPGFATEMPENRILQQLLLDRTSLSEDLAKLLVEMKPDHPSVLEVRARMTRVEEQVKEVVQGMVRGLEMDLEAKKAEERGLGTELADAQKKAAELAAKVNQYRQLEAEWTSARDVYNAYQKRYSENLATAGTPLVSIRVVDYAAPPKKHAFPVAWVIFTICGAGGLLLAVVGATVVDSLDNKIRTTEEVEAFVGLPVLSRVPFMENRGASDDPILLDATSTAVELEPFRKLRIEVLTRLQRLGGKIVCVVSPQSDEGKTTTALNLAAMIALQGLRVLLIDADLRQPKLLRTLGLTNAADITEYFLGKRPATSLVTQTHVPMLQVIGAQKGAKEAAEMAGSSRFYDLLEAMKGSYDAIVVDSPPTLLSSEAGMIAQRADATVLVVRDRVTRRSAALSAKRTLEALQARFIGAVVNAVRGRGEGYGYYAYEEKA